MIHRLSSWFDHQINRWEFDEADEFLKKTFNDHLGVSISDECIRAIIDKVTTIPVFIQNFCKTLISSRQRRHKSKYFNKVTPSEIEGLFSNPGTKNDIFDFMKT